MYAIAYIKGMVIGLLCVVPWVAEAVHCASHVLLGLSCMWQYTNTPSRVTLHYVLRDRVQGHGQILPNEESPTKRDVNAAALDMYEHHPVLHND